MVVSLGNNISLGGGSRFVEVEEETGAKYWQDDKYRSVPPLLQCWLLVSAAWPQVPPKFPTQRIPQFTMTGSGSGDLLAFPFPLVLLKNCCLEPLHFGSRQRNL